MKVAVAASLVALLLPAAARAEAVPGSAGATDAAFALAADGTPRVAFVSGGLVVVAARSAAGGWTSETAAGLPGPDVIADRVAGRFVLVQDANGSWLALEERTATGWRAHELVRSVPRGASLGLAGLALDAAGRPAVAYALRLPTRKTFLRIVRRDVRGRFVTRSVTKGGFPPSDTIPSATPVVLRGGGVRVVETYAGAAIEWAPQGRSWEGQFLYANAAGLVAGPVAAAAAAGGVYSAWTQLFDRFGESQLLLTLHGDGERTAVLHRHAFLVDLALAAGGPEVAADDYVGSDPAGLVYAGLVIDAAGTTLELGSKLVGYAAEPGGGRQFLLQGADGLEWYRAPTLPTVRVTLSAALTGTVAGATGGNVELYREQPGEPPALVATVPLAADGSFSAAAGALGTGPVLFRAVYRDALTGLPYGSLLRAPVSPRG